MSAPDSRHESRLTRSVTSRHATGAVAVTLFTNSTTAERISALRGTAPDIQNAP